MSSVPALGRAVLLLGLAAAQRAPSLSNVSQKLDTLDVCSKCQPVSTNQVHKNPRPVELAGRDRWAAVGFGQQEWEQRLELAALARVLYIYGFGSDLAAQCVMTRLREEPDTMLMNEWGFFFEETTASSLVKVRFGPGTPMEGVIVRPNGHEEPANAALVNIGCVPVGRAIFNARQDFNTVVHAHPYSVMAVGATKKGMLPLSQAAFFLHNAIGRYKYDFAYGDEFEAHVGAPFAAGKRAILLDHHGLYAAGMNAAEAWFVTYHLNQACEVQLRAQSSGQELYMPAEEDLQKQYDEFVNSTDYAYDGSREWAGCVRKLNRELPGYEL